ncbi:MAG: protein-methionine-sulfoxide reductase heme-binding subunit MsrQ [Chloroflexota bacterium]
MQKKILCNLWIKSYFLSKMETITNLKIGVHIAAWLPLVWLIRDFVNDKLTANPIQAAMQRTGRFALIFLVLTLACTPMRILFGHQKIPALRRMLGLYSFMYACIHLLIYTGLDFGFAWNPILQSLYEKRFIFVGLAAFIMLLLLAITSFRWWMKTLGKNWKRLHWLVYPSAVLVVLHYALAKKGDIFHLQGDILLPLLFACLLLGLYIIRLPGVRHWLAGLRSHPNAA